MCVCETWGKWPLQFEVQKAYCDFDQFCGLVRRGGGPWYNQFDGWVVVCSENLKPLSLKCCFSVSQRCEFKMMPIIVILFVNRENTPYIQNDKKCVSQERLGSFSESEFQDDSFLKYYISCDGCIV